MCVHVRVCFEGLVTEHNNSSCFFLSTSYELSTSHVLGPALGTLTHRTSLNPHTKPPRQAVTLFSHGDRWGN